MLTSSFAGEMRTDDDVLEGRRDAKVLSFFASRCRGGKNALTREEDAASLG